MKHQPLLRSAVALIALVLMLSGYATLRGVGLSSARGFG
jgi:hypothetical protein